MIFQVRFFAFCLIKEDFVSRLAHVEGAGCI